MIFATGPAFAVVTKCIILVTFMATVILLAAFMKSADVKGIEQNGKPTNSRQPNKE